MSGGGQLHQVRLPVAPLVSSAVSPRTQAQRARARARARILQAPVNCIIVHLSKGWTSTQRAHLKRIRSCLPSTSSSTLGEASRGLVGHNVPTSSCRSCDGTRALGLIKQSLAAREMVTCVCVCRRRLHTPQHLRTRKSVHAAAQAAAARMAAPGEAGRGRLATRRHCAREPTARSDR